MHFFAQSYQLPFRFVTVHRLEHRRERQTGLDTVTALRRLLSTKWAGWWNKIFKWTLLRWSIYMYDGFL